MSSIHKILLFILFIPAIKVNKYCSSRCGNLHLLCLRQPCDKGAACGSKFKILPLNDEEKLLLLDVHNDIRNKMAGGGATSLQINASDMHVLSYDKELEFFAQCSANSCYPTVYESVCRSCKRFSFTGENIFYGYPRRFRIISQKTLIKLAVDSWFKKKNKLTVGLIDSFSKNTEKGLRNACHLIFSSYRCALILN